MDKVNLQKEDRNYGNGMLRPELVPKNCHYMAPRDFLGVKAWDFLRRHVYKRAGYLCEICKSPGRNEAHERYLIKNDTMYLVRIVCLCPKCHEAIHLGLATLKGNQKRALAHMSKINKLSPSECMDVYLEELEIYHSRWNVTKINYDMIYNDPVLSRVIQGLPLLPEHLSEISNKPTKASTPKIAKLGRVVKAG